MNSMSDDAILAAHCLQQFTSFTGLDTEVSSASSEGDADVVLRVPDTEFVYRAEIKPRIDRIAALDRLKATVHIDDDTLLLTRYLSPELASHCQRIGLQFIDSAGNAYLNKQPGIFVFVSGRKASLLPVAQQEQSFATPAGLRVIFAFFAAPSLLNATYREIASASGVSLGLVGPVLSQLKTRGFLGTDGSGKRGLLHRRRLAVEWAAGYLGQLRPKLKKYRFTVAHPESLSELLSPPGLTWSGEAAASVLTNYLRPEVFTLYADLQSPVLAAMAAKLRMRPDPNGKLEIVERFWNPSVLEVGHLAPSELVYADLLAIPDTRNHKAADLILNELLRDA